MIRQGKVLKKDRLLYICEFALPDWAKQIASQRKLIYGRHPRYGTTLIQMECNNQRQGMNDVFICFLKTRERKTRNSVLLLLSDNFNAFIVLKLPLLRPVWSRMHSGLLSVTGFPFSSSTLWQSSSLSLPRTLWLTNKVDFIYLQLMLFFNGAFQQIILMDGCTKMNYWISPPF